MGRIRTIKPELPHSENLARCKREARLCFVLLWTLADDCGRLRGDSRLLASLLYPYDDDVDSAVMDLWLTDLESQTCITRYTSNGDNYIQIDKWTVHQKIDRPSKSKFPEPSRMFASPREETPRIKEGIKEGNGDTPQIPQAEKRVDFNASEVAHTLCDVFHWNLAGETIRRLVREVVEAACLKWSVEPQVAAERLDEGWRAFELAQSGQDPKFKKKVKGWLELGTWAESKAVTPKSEYVAGNSAPDYERQRREWKARQEQPA